ncbi:MAG TPA: carboxypeptidase-like regulatory domain-containing protein, partial [Ignavibacteria bacterium]|nr:carboxypeptidase-like regulatory domain-containing protein [Ignavibacteria bacterium]
MKSSLLYFTIVLFFSVNMFAQKHSVTGRVLDKQTGKPLGYANIKIDGTMMGGASNINGSYNLKLDKGNYVLIASYLGYNSDTLKINLNNNITGLDFTLIKSIVTLPEITVVPGEDPAIGIIRKAIKEKQKRKKQINSLIFESYTKGIIRTPDPLNFNRGRTGLGLGMGDSSKLPITGIIENQSIGYFKKPDDYKEIIIARKQTANIPSTFNLLTGGRAIKNFNNERINILNYPIPGPLADDALSYYDYYLVNLSSINNQSVFEIKLKPLDSINPGFTGKLYIIDKTFDLVKIDFQLNDAANRGGILDTINFYQQLLPFDDSLYLPVDFRVIAEINYLGLARFGFEMNTILYNYKINTKINDNIFDKAVIKVLPSADNKNTDYWKSIQTIPNTPEENSAYKKIDSLNNIPSNIWTNFSPLSSRVNINE